MNRKMGPMNKRGGTTGSRPISSERPMRDANATGRSDSTSWNQSNQGRSQPSDSDRREMDSNDQAGYSRDATAMATVFEPLNRSWKLSSRGYLGPVNAAKSPEGYSRNQDAIRTNLTAV